MIVVIVLRTRRRRDGVRQRDDEDPGLDWHDPAVERGVPEVNIEPVRWIT